MDWMTRFEILKEEGKVVGFRIDPQGTTEDECFCTMLPRKLHEGKASISFLNGKLEIESFGIYGKEKFSFDVNGEEGEQLQKILSGLGKTYQGHCELGGFGGCSLSVNFKKIVSLNKREEKKRNRSIGRNPTPPKNINKLERWKRIYA